MCIIYRTNLHGAGCQGFLPCHINQEDMLVLSERMEVSRFNVLLENIVRGQANSHNDFLASQSMGNVGTDHSQEGIALELSNDDEDQNQSSIETISVHQVIETHATTELESEITNITIDVEESATQVAGLQEETARERGDQEPSNEVAFSVWHAEAGEEFDRNWHENIVEDWPQETSENGDGEDAHLPGLHEEWREDESHDTEETWHNEQYDGLIDSRSRPVLLLCRRSVSNLLHSGFRESLDRLVQSYVERQGRTPDGWDLQRPLPIPNLPEEDQDDEGDNLNEDIQDAVVRPQSVFPPPPLPPRQPTWHSGLHHNWARQNMHRPETVSYLAHNV
ncbi:hypothetical protein GW17_00021788 [Ensete ventricosum]|nr:hypothetical protein GW17_00021788 [Ensete ventricosum]